MEAEALPRLELDPAKSRLHPGNMLRGAINGMLVMEEFRMGNLPEPGPSPRIARLQEKTNQMQAEHDEWRDETFRRLALQSKANEDPKQFMGPYLKEVKDYHVKRAAKLGARITALEVEKPRFVKARRWLAEKKRSYHRKRARVAAAKFIDFALSEA